MTRAVRQAACLFLTAGLVAALAMAAPSPAEAVERVRVTVGENGFDPPRVQVTEGEVVELTFVLSEKDIATDNRHVLFLEGLNLESEELSPALPETTIRFTAETTGRILFKCTLYCTGHAAMQEGYIEVRPAGGALAPPKATQISLAVGNPGGPGAKAILRALLTDADGQPVEGVSVRFAQEAVLIRPGWVHLGTARTDARGAALWEYRPFGTSLAAPIRAVFEGNVRFQPSVGTGQVQAQVVARPLVEAHEVRVPVLGPWLLWTVLASIWLTFGYVIALVVRLPEPHAPLRKGEITR
jgi:plastocyanin